MPTVDQLIEFLTKKCFALEAVREFPVSHSRKRDKDNIETKSHEKRNEFQQSKNYSYSLTERIRHLKQDCRSSGCRKCNQKHNTALHYEKRQSVERSLNPSNVHNSAAPSLVDKQEISQGTLSVAAAQVNNDASEAGECSLTLTSSNVDRSQVLLSTANILIADEKGNWHKCNALLDSGSQSNLISKSLCRKLDLSFKRISMPLSGISQTITKISRQTHTKIKSKFNSFEANLTFLVLPTLTENLPLFKFSKSVLKVPNYINLADEHFNEPKHIDVLLGVGIFYDLLGSGKLRLGDKLPVLQETYLGWVISGNLAIFESRNSKTICNLSTNISNKMLNDSLTKFWHVEEFKNSKFLSKEESYCEEYFTQTTTRDEDNNFIVKYPFKIDKKLKLGDSKTSALNRWKYLERKLNKDEELKKQYVGFMTEYENLGHMTREGSIEDDDSRQNDGYFLPHRAVIKNSITTKCRVVFDASCKTSSGISLNDILMVGPVVQEELYAILLRLRLRKIVLSADIKMMYRCIKIQESERKYQKILWRADAKDPISVYKLNTVTYGTSSAPFQATRCLVELADQNKNIYPRTSEIIKHSFYMDDLLTSVNSEAEALEIYKELSEIMGQANFKLRKWISNSEIVVSKILEANNNENVDNFILSRNNKELKTLGISWEPKQDILKYQINAKIESIRVTKRTILATISQIFDPLGLIGPALIRAKLIIQALWKLQLEWDQEVPSDMKQCWQEFITQLACLNECQIDRHVMVSNAVHVALYGFSDSSEKAYGACIYIKSVDNLGNHELRLLTGKSRVAPVKKLTVPRLELLAAHLWAELMHTIKQTLGIPLSR
ncbi:uncharacterized protein, partial [Euwallacea fornicatus]|uniref:uncharacterized protein n=1 Tax=Euwallacea fornicatus TaxID=995702 RepID=UPI00338FC005